MHLVNVHQCCIELVYKDYELQAGFRCTQNCKHDGLMNWIIYYHEILFWNNTV